MSSKIVVPELGESITEATIVRWLKSEGDPIQIGDVLLELETDKVNLEVGAEHAGVLTKIEVQPGADVKVGDTLGLIGDGKSAKAAEKPAAPPKEKPKATKPEAPTPIESAKTAEPPKTKAPVTQASPLPPESQPRPEPISAQPIQPTRPTPQPLPERTERETRTKMSRRRRTIAERLVEAQRTAAILTTFNDVDMGRVMHLRKRHRDRFEQHFGVRLGLLSFFVKATVSALKTFPDVNAEIQGDTIVEKHYYDIGVAMDAGQGLVVPIVRDADQKSFAQIESDVTNLADRARDGQLAIDDLRGGTFSITNGGVFGSMLSTPILNPPQVGILGLHRIQDRPVARDGEIVIRPMMYIALSYDHRIVDGRTAVLFLVHIKETLEDPERLLLEG